MTKQSLIASFLEAMRLQRQVLHQTIHDSKHHLTQRSLGTPAVKSNEA